VNVRKEETGVSNIEEEKDSLVIKVVSCDHRQ